MTLINNSESGASVRSKLNDLIISEARKLKDVATLLADTNLTYTSGQNGTVTAGNIVTTEAEGFSYEVAASGATDQHVTTSGGVNLYVQSGQNGLNVLAFGCPTDGTTDCAAAFQAAHDALPATGGKIVIPMGDYAVVASSPTINSPKRGMLITKDNVEIVAHGARFLMTGMTKTYLDSIDDLSSSARDVFTVFSFLRQTGGSVTGGEFVGEWDGTGTFRFASPRAKGVGVIGGSGCKITGVSGRNILGNVVNATPSDATIDGVYQECSHVIIQSCTALNCLENGFNFMGNTFDCVFSGNVSEGCNSTGFEAATERLSVTGNVFKNNGSAGASISGKSAVFSGNVCNGTTKTTGIGLILSASASAEAQDVIVSNNVFKNCDWFGIQVFPGYKKLMIVGNIFTDNNTNDTAGGADIQAVGSALLPIEELIIDGNTFLDTRGTPLTTYAANLNHVVGGLIANNFERGHETLSFLAQGNCQNIEVTRNNCEKDITLSTAATNSYSSFNSPSDRRMVWTNGAAPSTGTWRRGDWAINRLPSAGGISGWVCVADGSPGTWKAMAAIAA